MIQRRGDAQKKRAAIHRRIIKIRLITVILPWRSLIIFRAIAQLSSLLLIAGVAFAAVCRCLLTSGAMAPTELAGDGTHDPGSSPDLPHDPFQGIGRLPPGAWRLALGGRRKTVCE